jgi:hypothetical protein
MEQQDRLQEEKDKRQNFNDLADMEKKWGVSSDEVRKAICAVGFDKAKIEEYLVNNKWQKRSDNEVSFQKRDLNEDETY